MWRIGLSAPGGGLAASCVAWAFDSGVGVSVTCLEGHPFGHLLYSRTYSAKNPRISFTEYSVVLTVLFSVVFLSGSSCKPGVQSLVFGVLGVWGLPALGG